MSTSIVTLFLNGPLESGPADAPARENEIVIAVDGGLRHIYQLGRKPDYLIGDLDSVTEADVDRAWQDGARVMRYPPEKNETDFELALNEVLRMKPERVFIHAAVGGRMDQTLANLALAGSDRFAELDLTLLNGRETYHFIRTRLVIDGQPGDIVSLIPWEGPAGGVTTRNLKYPLHSETLFPDHSRGISNQMTAAQATVTLSNGRLLCIHTQKS